MSALGVSVYQQIRSNKSLYRFLKPIAGWYANLAGYRQHGLKYDDLIIEENPVMQKVPTLQFIADLEDQLRLGSEMRD